MSSVASSRPVRRRTWVDVRLLLGVALIVASVAGVWLVVDASRRTEVALAAVRTLVPGDPITPADVRLVDVGLGQLADAYLAPSALDGSPVATRVIAAGELVAKGAVDDAASLRTTRVVVRSAVDVPASIGPGTVVDIWSAPALEAGRRDVPRILVADATVVAVEAGERTIGAAAAAVEVVVARADVAAVLGAMTDGAALSLVPSPGGGR